MVGNSMTPLQSPLSHLLNNVHTIYPSVNHPVVDNIIGAIRGDGAQSPNCHLFDFTNLLFFGPDISLVWVYIRHIIRSNFDVVNLRPNTMYIKGSGLNELPYYETRYFIEINLDTHLNKDRNAYLDFIQTIVSCKSVMHKKHIIVLLNFDHLNFGMQSRLRRIFEKSQRTAMFILQCQKLNKIIPEIQSRFMTIRVPTLKRSSSINFMNYILSQNDMDISKWNNNKTKCHDNKYTTAIGEKLFDYVLKKTTTTFELNLFDIYMYTMIYREKYMTQDKTMVTVTIDDPHLPDDAATPGIIDFLKDDFVSTDLKKIFDVYQKSQNTASIQTHTRDTIMQLMHYNIPITVIARSALRILWRKKISNDKKIKIINILSTMDHISTIINPCKVVHCCEKAFIDIFCIMRNIN
jgi:hypothetical protein